MKSGRLELTAPKNIYRNCEHRRKLFAKTAFDQAAQTEVWIACRRDFVFWVDSFVWTVSPKDNPKHPRVPFILYPFQERAAASLIEGLGKEDRLVEKSRDMGATWLILLVFVWRLVFYEDQSFLIGSRKQEFVDKTGDPKCLFAKIDFILENLPPWMTPPIARKLNHIENLRLKSVIDGESTNENFGAGDRRVAVLLDEFALSDFGYRILQAVGDVTHCCIYNSTPMGASGAYFDTREKMAQEAPHRIIRLHWSDHPLKNKGLYTSDKDGNLKIIDTDYEFPKYYNFIRDGKLRSVPYDQRELRAANRQIMASQWDIDYVKAGFQFFDGNKLSALLADRKVVRRPNVTGEVIRDTDGKVVFISNPTGRLQLWFDPPPDGKLPFLDIVIGCDIASGSGGEMSSNSSASIVRRSTGEKIGELTNNLIAPNDFALYCLILCEWFNHALLIWERNGPNGAQFGKVIKDAKYSNLYYQRREARFDFAKYKEPGWYTNDESKAILLGTYAEALWSGAFINHSEQALLECGHYVQNGKKIEHSRSLAGATEDPTAVGESHSDRCFVAGTMILTEHGERPIESIAVGDLVWTREGLKPVIACGQTIAAAKVCEVRLDTGRSLVGTPNHPVYTQNEAWVQLSKLTPSHRLVSCQEFTNPIRETKSSNSTALSITAGRTPSTGTCACTSGRILDVRAREDWVRCTLRFGNTITDLFQKAISSITSMRTHLTTPLRTWPALLGPSTASSTRMECILSDRATCRNTPISASIAGKVIRRFARIAPNTADKPAKRHISESTSSTTKPNSASSAAGTSLPASTSPIDFAPISVRLTHATSVSSMSETAAVYNLSVAECPEYFANGVLVHNCIADALAYRGVKDRPGGGDKPTPAQAPVGSFAWRRNQWEANRRSERLWG